MRVITAGVALALAACSPEPPPEGKAAPVRGWDGEIVGDSLEEVPDSLALASADDSVEIDAPGSTTVRPVPPISYSPVFVVGSDEDALVSTYRQVTEAASLGESIIPWLSSTCRATLGLASGDDPLSSYLAEQTLLDVEREVVSISMTDDTAVLVMDEEYEIPSRWVVEGEQWKYGACGEVADGGDYTSTAPATEQGLSDRLEQLRRLHDADELVLYPWLSQSCREDAVESYATSWVGFLELSPISVSYWSFDDVEIIAVGSGRAAVSPVDPTNPTRFEGELASEWIHENGNWQYDSCLQPGETPIPLGADPNKPSLEQLHGSFYSTPLTVDGITENPTGSVTPGVQYNVFFEIDQPTVEADAHELIRSDFIPAMAEAGYTFEAESDGIYMFVLDADPCGRAQVSVVWPPPTSGAPKELVLGLFIGDC